MEPAGPSKPGPGADCRSERSHDTARRARGACARSRRSRSGSRRSTDRHRRKCRNFKALKDREAAGFTSALRETFKTIVFPTGKALRKVDDFRMEFERNDYSGEQQIIDTLTKRGKFIPSDKFDAQVRDIPPRCAGITVRRGCGSAILAPPQRGGALRLVLAAAQWPRSAGQMAVQRGFWREREGLIAKKWERRTQVTARLDDFGPNPIVTGRFQINVTPEDADIVYVSETGAARSGERCEARWARLRDSGARRVVPRRRQQGRRERPAMPANGVRRSA